MIIPWLSSSLFVLFLAANPLAHGEDLGYGINGLLCSPNRDCSGDGQALPGAEVRLNITNNQGGRPVIAGRNTTDDRGSFYIYIYAQFGTSINDRRVSVRLPIEKCLALSSFTGELVASVKYTGTKFYPSENRLAVYGTALKFTVRKD